MKPFLSSLFLIAFSLFSYGQGNFQISYGSTNLDKCNDINFTPDGGFIITGEMKNSDGNQSITLTKTNAQGTIAWSRSYLNGVFEMPNSVLNVQGGGYLVAGERYPSSGPAELAYVFQVNQNGALQWSRIFDGGGNMAEALAAKTTIDGGYILAGRAERTIVANNIFLNMSSEMRYLYLLKMDQQGDPVWSKKYNTGEQIRMDRANEVYSCKDGGYIVAGEFKHNDIRTDLDMGLLKVDKNGNVVWARQFGGNKSDAGTEVIETQDGGYILAGETESFGAGKLDIFLIKTDNTGAKIWSKTYGDIGYDQVGSIYELSGGNIAVVGTTTGTNKDVQVLVLILNKMGTLISSNAYGGKGIDNAVSVRQMGNSLLIGANTTSFGSGGMDMMMMKYNLSAPPVCNASSINVSVTDFSPTITDMTSSVNTEAINESSSIRVVGNGSTQVENTTIESKVLCK